MARAEEILAGDLKRRNGGREKIGTPLFALGIILICILRKINSSV